MHIIHVKPDQEIAVVRKDLLFRFDIAPADEGRVHISFHVPARDDDGEMVSIDTLELETVGIGDVYETGYEGLDAGEEIEGDVTIMIMSFENEVFCVSVNAPEDWDVIANPIDLDI